MSAGLLSAGLLSAGLSVLDQGKGAGLLSIALLSLGLSAIDPSPSLEESEVPDKGEGPAGAAPGNIEEAGALGVGAGAVEDDVSGPGEGDEGAGSADFFS